MEDWHGTGDRHGGVLIGFGLETSGAEPGTPPRRRPVVTAGAGAAR